MTWLRCVLLSVSCVLLVLPAVAHAQSNDEEEARRQLDIARQQVDQGNFEKALSAADTALRLYPSLYQAMMFKALAYEGLGNLKRAESLLSTFKELAFRADDKAAADTALERVSDKLGEARAADRGNQPGAEARGGGGSTNSGNDEPAASSTEGQAESEEKEEVAADKKTASKKTASKKTASKKTASKKTASKKTASKKTEKAEATKEEPREEVAAVAAAEDDASEIMDGDDDDDDDDDDSNDDEPAVSAGADESETSGSSEGKAQADSSMPDLPEGSEEFLAWMLHQHRKDLLEARRDMGVGLLVGGGALTGIGAGLAAGMAAESLRNPGNANVEAVYAAGLGSIFGGVTLLGVSIPIVLLNVVALNQLGPAPAPAAALGLGRPVRPSLSLGPGGGLALRF